MILMLYNAQNFITSNYEEATEYCRSLHNGSFYNHATPDDLDYGLHVDSLSPYYVDPIFLHTYADYYFLIDRHLPVGIANFNYLQSFFQELYTPYALRNNRIFFELSITSKSEFKFVHALTHDLSLYQSVDAFSDSAGLKSVLSSIVTDRIVAQLFEHIKIQLPGLLDLVFLDSDIYNPNGDFLDQNGWLGCNSGPIYPDEGYMCFIDSRGEVKSKISIRFLLSFTTILGDVDFFKNRLSSFSPTSKNNEMCDVEVKHLRSLGEINAYWNRAFHFDLASFCRSIKVVEFPFLSFYEAPLRYGNRPSYVRNKLFLNNNTTNPYNFAAAPGLFYLASCLDNWRADFVPLKSKSRSFQKYLFKEPPCSLLSNVVTDPVSSNTLFNFVYSSVNAGNKPVLPFPFLSLLPFTNYYPTLVDNFTKKPAYFPLPRDIDGYLRSILPIANLELSSFVNLDVTSLNLYDSLGSFTFKDYRNDFFVIGRNLVRVYLALNKMFVIGDDYSTAELYKYIDKESNLDSSLLISNKEIKFIGLFRHYFSLDNANGVVSFLKESNLVEFNVPYFNDFKICFGDSEFVHEYNSSDIVRYDTIINSSTIFRLFFNKDKGSVSLAA